MDIDSPNAALTRRSVLQIGGALGIGGVVGAGTSMPAFAAGNDTPLPATILTSSGSVSLVLDALIKQQGFYTDMGVNVTTLTVTDGGKVIAALLSGAADLCCGTGFSSVFPAIGKGAKIKIVSGAVLIPETAVSQRPDIKVVKDLVGKTYGIGPLGSLLHELAVALMTKHGVDPSKVTFVDIGNTPDVSKAVIAGRVDAGPGEVELYFDQAKYGVHSLTDGVMWNELPEYTNQAMLASDSAIADKREVLVRCMAALAKLYRFVQTPEAKDAWRKARATVFGKDDSEAALAQWQFYSKPKALAANLEMDEARLNFIQNLNVKLGVQPAILPVSQVADLSLIPEALKRLG